MHLVDALNRNGRSPEVIAGVEHDTSLLCDAADRTWGPALFVLCQTEDLDRSQALRLEGLFSARKGPEHHLLIVDVGDPSGLKCLPLIEAAVESVARGHHLSPQASAARAAHVPTRDIVVLHGHPENERPAASEGRARAQREAASADAEALARALHDEMVAAEAAIERRRSSRGDTVEETDAPGDGVPVAVPADPEASTRQIETVAPSDSASGEATTESLTRSLSKVRVAEPLRASTAPDTITTELTPTALRKRLREPVRDEDVARIQSEPGPSRSGLLLGLLGAAALIGLGLFALGGSDERSGERSASTAAPTVAAAALAGTHAARSDAAVTPRRAVAPAPKTARAMPAPAEAEAEAIAAPAVPPPAEPLAPSEAAPDADSPTPSPISPPTRQDDPERTAPTPVSAVPPPPTDSEPLRIDQAIRSGRVRAIDSLLVIKAGSEELAWSQAKASCRTKRVEGLGGWRLPSRHEISRLRRARVLTSGVYWSRDRGDVDDEAYGVNAATGASHRYITIEPAARAQCVRRR